jgi:hypothetical protein
MENPLVWNTGPRYRRGALIQRSEDGRQAWGMRRPGRWGASGETDPTVGFGRLMAESFSRANPIEHQNHSKILHNNINNTGPKKEEVLIEGKRQQKRKPFSYGEDHGELDFQV